MHHEVIQMEKNHISFVRAYIFKKRACTILSTGGKMMDIPIWIYFVVTGIIISAFMAIKTGKEERQEEIETIEKEGEVYITRLEKEREERSERQVSG